MISYSLSSSKGDSAVGEAEPTHSVRGQPWTHQLGSSSFWPGQALQVKPHILLPQKDVVSMCPAHNSCLPKTTIRTIGMHTQKMVP